MERVLIIGWGYPAFKAAQTVQELKPGTDLLWLVEYDDPKYPLEMLELLLQTGSSPGEWSKLRAKVKIEFERKLSSLKLAPTKAKKIRLDSRAREVSFLTNAGHTTYTFDRAFVFPEPAYSAPEYAPAEAMLWPESSSAEHFIRNWGQIRFPVVAGDDWSLVQALLSGGKEFTWIRNHTGFCSQLQLFLDKYLESCGVEVVPAKNEQELKRQASAHSTEGKWVFCSATPVLDQEKLVSMGCQELTGILEKKPVLAQDNLVLVAPYADPGSWALGTSFDWNLLNVMFSVRLELGEASRRVPVKRMWTWKLKDMYLGKVGTDVQESSQMGWNPEWVVLSDQETPWSAQGFILKLVVDKNTRTILGMQSMGRHAAQWLELAGMLLSKQAQIDDILEQEFSSHSWGIHPVKRCASMLKNKLDSRILGISPEEFQESIRQGAEFFLMDVRSWEEYSRSRIPGAENIPFTELKNRINEIPRFVPLVIYSRCSGRAYDAARLLKSQGAKQLYVVDGGIDLWPWGLDEAPASQKAKVPSFSCGC